MKCIKKKLTETEWKYMKVSDSAAMTMQSNGTITLDRDDLSNVPIGKAVFISKSEYKRKSTE